MTTEIVIYTREGCGLCAAAEDVVARAVGRHADRVRLRRVDIDDDPDVQAAYNVRVPVVVLDGSEIHDAGGDPAQLGARVRRAVRLRFGLRRRTS